MATAGSHNDREFAKMLAEKIPKVELHLHIEGTFEPELMFEIARRNKVQLKYDSVEELRGAYNFSNLQSFLDLYYQGMGVLLHEQDFHDLTYAYFKRVHQDNVRHVELFYDPQGHTERGVSFDTCTNGVWSGMKAAERDFGITSYLIMSFLRHLPEEDAFKTLEQARPHLDKFIGVGLDSGEVGNPPSKFERVFAECRKLGLKIVAHAGEEGPPSYIHEALDLLKIDRLDHGVRAIEDEALVSALVERQMALTTCPQSNLKLCVIKRMEDHQLKRLLDAGLRVTINSDDPAYFGGYMTDNYHAVIDALDLKAHDVITVTRYSFDATFLPGARRVALHRELSEVIRSLEAEKKC